uniref:Hemerythrin n=3 Tax=Annelida TaxID=6340 RepID=A0A1S6QCZ9_HETFI|nr:hemerythrin [Galathowenia oculata]AQV13666.1 hemerythrin [Heteromastus filiformis]AQV13773.1 hemerythrin [Themiste pyroides]
MSFPIPEPYVWDESFRVFYDNLDDEHKGLFDAVFKVAGSPKDAGALSHLVTVTDNHFTNEQGMMKAANYGDFSTHCAAHKGFLDKIRGLKAPVDDATIKFAKEWLVNHIKGTDFKYKEKL